MKNLLKATLYRVWKSSGVKIVFMITVVVAALYYMCGNMVAGGSIDAAGAGSVTGLGDAMILWIFGPLVTAMVIGSDFENKTIHGAIGYGRGKVIVNDMLVYAICMLVLTLPYILGSVLCLAGGVNMEGAQMTAVSACMDTVIRYNETYGVGKVILTYLAFACVTVGQISICVPVAVKVKKPVIVTAFGFFFGMITALLATLASKVEAFQNVYKLTPYAYGLAEVNLDAEVSDLLLAILISMIFTGVMGLVAWLLFKKAEIK
ncbi:MAG: hypothetical protein IJ405_01750 [Lachnospiraceae bacterium]|nr:hypothetical protein [Lachnospiraceae bacterium]